MGLGLTGFNGLMGLLGLGLRCYLGGKGCWRLHRPLGEGQHRPGQAARLALGYCEAGAREVIIQAI